MCVGDQSAKSHILVNCAFNRLKLIAHHVLTLKNWQLLIVETLSRLTEHFLNLGSFQTSLLIDCVKLIEALRNSEEVNALINDHMRQQRHHKLLVVASRDDRK